MESLAAARGLNRYTKEEKLFTGFPTKKLVSITRPGDDYNLRGDMSEVLRDAGWAYAYSRGASQYWRRPGKTEGISASFNNQPNMFYVFTEQCRSPGAGNLVHEVRTTEPPEIRWGLRCCGKRSRGGGVWGNNGLCG